MIDFIIKLEDMLRLSGYEDWEIMYSPKEHSYVLIFDDDTIIMHKAEKKE